MISLAGGVALITGAGSGIGRAIAISLAREGMQVYLLGRNLDKLRETAKQCVGNGATRAYSGDINETEFITETARSLAEEFGHLNVLVHSAGAIHLGGIRDLSIEQLDEQFRTNLRAPFAITQAFLPLLEGCEGQIVVINSSAGAATARSGQSQYAASKHALRAFADSLRDELNPRGVRVLSVYPGRTASPMQQSVHELERRNYRPEELLQPEDIAHVVLSALTLSRTGEITDVHIRPMKNTRK